MQRLARVVAVLLTIAGGIYLLCAFLRSNPRPTGMQEFFSTDNGKTWFADDGMNIPPFDHDGKPAVLVKVYQAKDGTQFVGYMMKFTDEAKKQIAVARTGEPPRVGLAVGPGGTTGTLLIKRPADRDWVADTDPSAEQIRNVVGPDGSKNLLPVLP